MILGCPAISQRAFQCHRKLVEATQNESQGVDRYHMQKTAQAVRGDPTSLTMPLERQLGIFY